MLGRISTCLAALVVAAASQGCKTEPADGGGDASAAADTPETPAGEAAGNDATGKRRPIAVSCAMGDAIEAKTRTEVVARAQELVAALRSGRHEALWQALHPQAQRPADRAPFLNTLATLQGRLEDSMQIEPRVEMVALGSIKGGINDVARLVCHKDAEPAADTPPDLSVLVNAGNEDVAYVSVVVPGAVYEHAAVLQLRKRDTWRLLGVQVHPSRFRNKTATDWVNQAGQLRRAQKLVPGYVALAMAAAMATRGSSVTTPLSVAIETDLETLRKHPLFIAETKAWTVDGQDFDLHGLSLAATKKDVSLVVKYVNERGLVQELVGRDADKLMDHVRTQYPELETIVDAVVFEAYAKAPTKPGDTVEAFRVARFF